MLDRQTERRAIDEVLDQVRRGFSSSLVLRGGHGVGKTTLVDYAVASAAGFRVCQVVGVESELELEFAAVHQLLAPFLALVDDLPAPQRDAVNMAFGLEAGTSPPDPFLIGLACLTLVSRAAETQPVLWAIDDAHWIDAESATVLGFVARRLYADRVGIILTVDESYEPDAFEQLRTLDVGGLPAGAAAELLQSVVQAQLQPQVVGRILKDTAGNALALVEVGSQFTATELTEMAYSPEPMPAGPKLAQRYLQQVRRLPESAQQFLLLLAADGTGDRSLVRRAAECVQIDADAAEAAAEEAGLIEVSSNLVRFRHPLIRAAVYSGATDLSRRHAHGVLGEACGDGRDSDQQIWHRAAASVGPDEKVAADLQSAAERAGSRGAWSTAAGLMRRSVDLTPDAGRRAVRQIAMAQAQLVTGHPDIARQSASVAVSKLPDDSMRGQAKVLCGEALFTQGAYNQAADVLLEASTALASDPAAATDALLAAYKAAIWAGRPETDKVASRALLPPRPSDSAARVSDLLLAGYHARFTAGYDAAAAPLREALRRMRADDLDSDTGTRWFGLAVTAAGSLWDDEGLIDISERWVNLCRRLGAVSYLPVALAARAFADWLTGHLDQAADRWAELRELAEASHMSDPLPGRSLGLLHAYRGETAAALASGQALVRESTAQGRGGIADMGRSVLAVANLRAGEPQAALAAAQEVIEHDPAFTAEQTLPELVEAAVRSDRKEVAARAFATLDSRGRTAHTHWALGLRARSLALISDGERAEEAFSESVSQLERCRARVDLARAHLLYGAWLRRGKRRRDARRQLRIAEDMYDAMGAEGFASAARDERSATGERARARRPETEFELTPQESRVAALAAEGSTNSEISGQLFISPSTVDYHLGKVFRKLGVRSRTELALRLQAHP